MLSYVIFEQSDVCQFVSLISRGHKLCQMLFVQASGILVFSTSCQLVKMNY